MEKYESIWERAERNVPDARQEPLYAGIGGAMLTAFALSMFLIVAGIEKRGRVEVATVTAVALGFIGPYFHYRGQRKRHIAETVRLYQEEARRNAER